MAEDGLEPLGTDGWTWPEWQALTTWFDTCLAEEDWRARLSLITGGAFAAEPDLSGLPWRTPDVVEEHIARGRSLRAMSVADYANSRLGFVQGYVRRLGISLSRSSPEHERFMAACLKAELAYLDVFQQRESRQGGLEHPHPDTIDGPWRRDRRSEPSSGTDHSSGTNGIGDRQLRAGRSTPKRGVAFMAYEMPARTRMDRATLTVP